MDNAGAGRIAQWSYYRRDRTDQQAPGSPSQILIQLGYVEGIRCRGASGSDQPQLDHQRSCPTGSDAMRGRFGRRKNPFPMDLGSGALESRRYRPAPAGRALLAAAAGHPCRLWRYYSMTRSASCSSEFGIWMPICVAAFRLITSSKRVGSSTGRVAGSAPLAILST